LNALQLTRRLRLGRIWPRPAAWLLLAGLWPAVAVTTGHDGPRFAVASAAIRLVNEVYHLDARLELVLGQEVVEALESGVPLTFEMQIEILQQRALLWDSTVATLSQRHVLVYRALSDQYLVTNLNTKQQRSYPSRRAALADLAELDDFPMLDRRLLKVGAAYVVRLRTRLDIESLPLPLRPVAYLSSAWDLTSEWHAWLLNP
jgi:hypothetical protein